VNQYIGTKVIKAEAAPKDGKPGYKVEYEDGYVSWSPKDVFEAAYRKNGYQSFGHAIEWMIRGEAVARHDWSEDEFLYLVPVMGCQFLLEVEDPDEPVIWTGKTIVKRMSNGTLMPWVPNQDDLLCEGWGCLNEACDDEEDESYGVFEIQDELDLSTFPSPPGSDSEAEGPTSEAAPADELGVALTLMLAAAYSDHDERFTRDHARTILDAMENGVRVKVFESPED